MTTANQPSGDGFAVVVVAAGSGTRLGLGQPKALVKVGGRSILDHSLAAVFRSQVGLSSWQGGDWPVVVTVPAGDTQLTAVAYEHGAHPVAGGATRAASVRAALDFLTSWQQQTGRVLRGVLIHDAARCLTPPEVFYRVVQALENGHSAVVPVMPVVDTIRAFDAHGNSQGTVDRDKIKAVQTPQGFAWDVITSVNSSAADQHDEHITDDASLVERFSDIPVSQVLGDHAALKITRPMDLLLAQAILAAREKQSWDFLPTP